MKRAVRVWVLIGVNVSLAMLFQPTKVRAPGWKPKRFGGVAAVRGRASAAKNQRRACMIGPPIVSCGWLFIVGCTFLSNASVVAPGGAPKNGIELPTGTWRCPCSCRRVLRSEEDTSELQSRGLISYAVL